VLKDRRQRFLLASMPALAAVLALAGCGGKVEDSANGKQLFTQKCGSCHVLADAKSKGVIGPNLDNSFKQAIADGEGRDTVQGVVKEQILVPLPTGAMPAKLVTGKDAEDVAAYVAAVVGKTAVGGAGGTPSGGGQGGTAKANARNQVEIPADPTGQLRFEFTSATAKAGKVTLLSKNASSVPHDISVKDGVNKQGPMVSGGKTSKVSVDLKPGKYEFYCSVPGHEQAGMKGTLTVE
jgi:uncharacterized cupredoxin-like copper-binding protein